MTGVSREDITLTANTLRCLAMDGVQKAGSGHPGMPMGMADVAAVLLLELLKHCPPNPDWPDRDRFILSAGHGSMLLYSMLHLSGYDLPMSELESFRQWGSLTPGHPEHGVTPGAETTTGPLGQGCGNAVGMALAERMLAARFNTDDFTVVDHHTYVLASDGDLMEGLSHEAFSLAGHLALNKLIVIYDDNHVTIEGKTSLAYGDNVKKRFQGYNWNVLETDAHDCDRIAAALKKARRGKFKPTIIIAHSHIGHGSPNMHDTAESHGAPLGEKEVALAKENLGMPPDRSFYVPDRVRAILAARLSGHKRRYARWQRMFAGYRKAHPDKAAAWDAHMGNVLPEGLETLLPQFDVSKPVATRSASGKVIQKLAAAIPALVGGSADLAPSTKTLIDNAEHVGPNAYAGRNLHFGIREHAMCSMLNGMALHRGFRVYGATFFVFLDYCRPSVRLAGLMRLPVIYVFTHDTFCVGEDGPTHQPIEHLATLRAIPGMTVIRPADAGETGAAWIAALKNTAGPTALVLTRQNVPVLDRSKYPPASNLERGGYVLSDTGTGTPDIVFIASGSEVGLALDTAARFADKYAVRVVSMPSAELFDRQDDAYRANVIPPGSRIRVVLEAGIRSGLQRYARENDCVVAIDRFGASGPYKILLDKFGFTPDAVARLVGDRLNC